jgi:hypothetical protein
MPASFVNFGSRFMFNAARVLSVAGVSLALAGTLLVWQRHPIVWRALRAPASDARVEEADAGDFFARRNVAFITLPRDMSLHELIGLYQLEHSRQQLLQELGPATDPKRVQLLRGRRVRVLLTPRAEQP